MADSDASIKSSIVDNGEPPSSDSPLISAATTPPNLPRLGSHPAAPGVMSDQSTRKETSIGDNLTSSNSISLLLLRPSSDSTALDHKNEIVKIDYSNTKTHQVKTHISATWQGKPKFEGIRLIARGRILNDTELIGQALTNQPGDSPPHPVHVVIKPNSWTEKLPVTSDPPRPLSAPPSGSAGVNGLSHLTPPPVSGTPASTSDSQGLFSLLSADAAGAVPSSNTPPGPVPANASPYPPSLSVSNMSYQLLWTHFSHLSRAQRASFIDNLLKAQFLLVERLELLRRRLYSQQVGLLGLQPSEANSEANSQTRNASSSDEAWALVDHNLTQLLHQLQYWGDFDGSGTCVGDILRPVDAHPGLQQEPLSEFQRAEIGGLPFLLYIPSTFQRRSNRQQGLSHLDSPLVAQVQAFEKTRKELARALHLDTRLHLLILQTKKIESTFNHLDYLTSVGPGSLLSSPFGNGAPPAIRYPPFGDALGARPNQAPDLGAFPPPRPNPGPYNVNFGNPPNQNGIPPVVGAGGLGFAAGVGNGFFPLPPNMLMGNPPVWPPPMARVRRYEFTINLDSIRRYMAPLLWLSLKLSFLLYIFGRHASFNKRAILVGLAVGWVLWEAFAISQRHEAQARRRERVQRFQGAVPGGVGGPVDPVQAVLDRGRRRAERERAQQRLRNAVHTMEAAVAPANRDTPRPATQPPPSERQPVAAPAVPPRPNGRQDLRAAAADIRARGGAFPPGTEVRPFRTTSAFSPKYWFNSIAVVGLASEYKELGLHPIGERTMGSSNSEYPRWYRFARNFKTGFVLFFGTLLPDIEKKRKKALEKRSRILNLVLADAARERENNANGAQPVRNEADAGTGSGRGVSRSGTWERERSSSGTPTAREVGQSTPRTVTATAIQSPSGIGQQALVSRHQKSRADSDDDRPNQSFDQAVTPRASSSSSGALVDQDNSATPPGCPSPPGPSTGVPAPLIIPPISRQDDICLGEAAHTESQAAPVTAAGSGLDSPMTPLNERQVVGGLDDTDDEELIGGGEEDEPGMMLF